jgi:hypothetical protein
LLIIGLRLVAARGFLLLVTLVLVRLVSAATLLRLGAGTVSLVLLLTSIPSLTWLNWEPLLFLAGVRLTVVTSNLSPVRSGVAALRVVRAAWLVFRA